MRLASVMAALLVTVFSARAEATGCDSVPTTIGERSLAAIFDALDDLGRAAYDAAMPGDVITFHREGGRWRASVPPAALRRARAKGCDLVGNIEDAAAFYGPSVDLSD